MQRSIVKSLRFRLAVSYALFFAILLTGFGFALRGVLRGVVESTAKSMLDDEWAACKGFLRVDSNGLPVWDYDANDNEAVAIVERLRLIYMIANDKGEVLESSQMYRDMGFQSPAVIAKVLSSNQPSFTFHPNIRGQVFMVREGTLREGDKKFFVALGRNFSPSLRVIEQFSFDYFAGLPLVILTASFLGWLLAKRAIKPVIDVASEVAKVTGSNLTLRVPLRGAGDELDLMISTFNGMVERLEKSFHQVRQFSTDVSHELRTPITVVRGQLEVALMTARDEGELRRAIEDAINDIDRLSSIVRALLNLAKAEAGQLKLEQDEVDLAALVRGVLSELEIPAEDRGVSLKQILPREAWMRGDRVQLERLLFNLIDNGIKYTSHPGFVEVVGVVDEIGGIVVLEIRDNGEGIAAEHIPHLFDRFYRVPRRENEEEKGLGLGLSFASWIVKAHNGEIQVSSKPGEGTTFRVSFPLLVTGKKQVSEHANQRESAGRHQNS